MNIKFLIQYIMHPRTTGAILPSSKRLSKKMIKEINFDKCNCIIELGPGTGVFTEEILKRRNVNTKVILIEYNREFYKLLKSKYDNIEKIYIINDSAENIDCYIKKYSMGNVDYIVSGLLFESLPSDMSEDILDKSKSILGDKGRQIKKRLRQFRISIEYSKKNC